MQERCSSREKCDIGLIKGILLKVNLSGQYSGDRYSWGSGGVPLEKIVKATFS